MTRRYFELYEQVVPRRAAHSARRRSRSSRSRRSAELESLEHEWIALWERTPEAGMFQRPEWILPWCRAFRRGALRSVALRRAGRLIGLAPLHVRTHGGRARSSALLGAGVSDYPDVLIEPAAPPEASRALSRWIAQDGAFDACAFECLRANPRCCARPRRAASATASSATRSRRRSICAPGSPPGSPRCRAPCAPNLQARLEPRAPARRRARSTATADSDEYFAALVRLHGACWRARGQPGVLDEAAVQAFHRAVIAAFAARGMLAFRGLRREGRARRGGLRIPAIAAASACT